MSRDKYLNFLDFWMMVKEINYVLALGILLIFPSVSVADELDDVLDYLVEQRQEALKLGVKPKTKDVKSAAKKASRASLKKFSSSDDYSVKSTRTVERGGVVETISTFVPSAGFPHYKVRLVRPAKGYLGKAKLGLLSDIRSLNVLYQRSKRNFATKVKGYRAAFIDYNRETTRGVITDFGNSTYLVVDANTSTPVEVVTDFISTLPLQEWERLLDS